MQKKILSKETDLKNYFPDFEGNSRDLVQVQDFILKLFASIKKDPTKALFHHYTTAVDTENIKYVFNAVKNTILDRNLKSLMLQ